MHVRLIAAVAALAAIVPAAEPAGTIATIAPKAGLVMLQVSDAAVGDPLFVIRDGQVLAQLTINKVISERMAEASVSPAEAVKDLLKGDSVYPFAQPGEEEPGPTLPISPEILSRSERILGQIADEAAGIRDFTATAAMDTLQDGRSQKFTLQVAALLPDKYRMTSTVRGSDTPHETDVLSNGRCQWVVSSISGERKVARYDIARVDDALTEKLPAGSSYADLRNPVMQMLFTREAIDAYKRNYDLVVLDTTTLQTRSAYLIQARPRTEAGVAAQVAKSIFGDKVSAIKFWVGTVDGFVYRSQVLGSSGQVLRWQEVSRTRFNRGIPPEAFDYVPEGDEEIVDRTDELIKQELQKLSALAEED